MKRRSSTYGFTLIELLVVIAIIAVLASLVVGLSGTAGRKMTESRIQAEIAALDTAIEAYKVKFGHYPPDNPDNPALNSLYYELTGVLYSPTRRTFKDPESGNIMSPKLIKERFGVDGFVNGSKSKSELKKFYEPRAENVRHLSEEHAEMIRGMGMRLIILTRFMYFVARRHGHLAGMIIRLFYEVRKLRPLILGDMFLGDP